MRTFSASREQLMTLPSPRACWANFWSLKYECWTLTFFRHLHPSQIVRIPKSTSYWPVPSKRPPNLNPSLHLQNEAVVESCRGRPLARGVSRQVSVGHLIADFGHPNIHIFVYNAMEWKGFGHQIHPKCVFLDTQFWNPGYSPVQGHNRHATPKFWSTVFYFLYLVLYRHASKYGSDSTEMPTVPFLQYLVLFTSCKYLWCWAKCLKILFFFMDHFVYTSMETKWKIKIFKPKYFFSSSSKILFSFVRGWHLCLELPGPAQP